MSRDTESGAVSPDAGSGGVSRDAGSGAAPAGVTARGRRWPAMGARYERSATADRPAPAGADRPRAPAEIWDAIDRGTDPTG